MKIHQNFSLKNHNTFGVDVTARCFVEVSSVGDLTEALNYAKNHSLTTLFLGGGSNILFTQDFDGMVIQLNLKGISEESTSENEVFVTAKAGENWHEFVQFCLSKNYGGLENLSLIPGNVGTSPMQNIGAYGTEIKDVFGNCKVLNLDTLEVEIFNAQQCRFGYRESFFKKEGKGKYVILEVAFKLTRKNHQIRTEYGAIQAELEKLNLTNPTVQDVSMAVINIRQSKLPDPKVVGNAGSFFKNPTIPLAQFEELHVKFPLAPGYPNGDVVKVPAGWLIEQCGWKGRQIGNVASHPLQALVIVNATGKATGKEIFGFSSMIIDSVEERFGIELEREVNVI
ncbi:UDP-N-acetylenolpyruvoylglucosamine reductase [Flavobacteriaceae bacterium 3519-10]|nr:UDP-N-acetylenolpyruvoylglucosamine reductase [Flavobacteriaceae bacterium 3519-10]